MRRASEVLGGTLHPGREVCTQDVCADLLKSLVIEYPEFGDVVLISNELEVSSRLLKHGWEPDVALLFVPLMRICEMNGLQQAKA